MNNNEPILIFGYAFPHRKTYDFVTILFALGFQNITVVGAPKVKLAHDGNITNTDEISLNAYCVKTLCRTLRINFEECAHDDIKKISEINNRMQADTAIVSGARIIKREVIDLFPNGIVNFHPGMIPETSGLDSFFHSIKKNCPMGITVHLIDHKVDAGRFIFFEKLRVNSGESMKIVKENLYGIQLVALRKYINFYFGRQLSFSEIDRPLKNLPLTVLEKEIVTANFMQWVSDREKEMSKTENQFFDFCTEGNLQGIKALIKTDSYLLSSRSPEGWSGIIIASFGQHFDLVKYFLKLGASPNDTGSNGTTVLMYAKTKLLDQPDSDLSMLELLLKEGANLRQRDNLGKDIFDYLNADVIPEERIAKYLKSFYS